MDSPWVDVPMTRTPDVPLLRARPVFWNSASRRSQTIMAFSLTPALFSPATTALTDSTEEETRGAPRQLILMPTTSDGEKSDDQAAAWVFSPVSSRIPASKARSTAAGLYFVSMSMSEAATETTRLEGRGAGTGPAAGPRGTPALAAFPKSAPPPEPPHL